MRSAHGALLIALCARGMLRSPWQCYAARSNITQPVAMLRSPWQSYAARSNTTQPVAILRSPWHSYAARGKVTQPVALCSLRSAHCALLNERGASSIWSPSRSMVLYGPIFRREVRVPWLPLFGPRVGPWSFMVPYFVGRFVPRGLPLVGPLVGPWSFMVPYFVGRFVPRGFLYWVPY